MRASLVILGVVVAAGLVLMTGCRKSKVVVVEQRGPVAHERPHRERPVVVQETVVVHERPPVVVDHRPAEVIVVREAPPPVRVEVRPAPPSRNHVWISGYYSYHGPTKKFVWVSGRYDKSPREGSRWEPDRWEKVPGGHKHVPGRWR